MLELIKIIPGVYFVPGQKNGRPPFCNGLLIDSDIKALVDPGFGEEAVDSIKAAMHIDVIINTHFHIDHIYGNRHFSRAQFWTHRLDAAAMQDKNVLYDYIGFNTPGTSHLKSLYPNQKFFPKGLPKITVARELVDGDVLDFGGVVLRVLHTPGHTPGHICLYEPENKILFSGDLFLENLGPWYGHTSSSIEDFIESTKKIIELKPRILITSHEGIYYESITEKLKSYMNIFYTREIEILKLIKEPKSLEELVNCHIIYRTIPEPKELFSFYKKVMIAKHLSRLVSYRKAVRLVNGMYCGI